MTVLTRLLHDEAVFDPAATEIMATAYAEICTALELDERDEKAKEVVAKRIIELARRGERDPIRLRDRVLSEAKGSKII